MLRLYALLDWPNDDFYVPFNAVVVPCVPTDVCKILWLRPVPCLRCYGRRTASLVPKITRSGGMVMKLWFTAGSSLVDIASSWQIQMDADELTSFFVRC